MKNWTFQFSFDRFFSFFIFHKIQSQVGINRQPMKNWTVASTIDEIYKNFAKKSSPEKIN
jgi:CRISPR/Cas system endoribonuclease Cas6 (RAMP superfamily)